MTDTIETEKTSKLATMAQKIKPSNLSDDKKDKLRTAAKYIALAGATALLVVATVAQVKTISAKFDDNGDLIESDESTTETPDNE